MKLIKTSFKIIILFIVLLADDLFSQSNLEIYPTLQSYVTPSPQATAITRYGDYPVNYNTGMVDMRVPVYTIKSGSLSLPIDMSFHASGRMANETNGILGMRWVLNAGGIITRTVQGYPDEWNGLGSYPYAINSNHQPDFEELYASCIEGFEYGAYPTRYDTEFDIFTYVLPAGKSGKFILKNVNGEKKAFTIPYEPFKIELDTDGSPDGLFTAISITDLDGTVYKFGNQDLVNYSEYFEYNYDHYIINMPANVPTGWYLESMVSADKQDTIHFNYNGRVAMESGNYIGGEMVSDRPRDMSNFGYMYYYSDYLIDDIINVSIGENTSSYNDRLSNLPAISSIDFKHGSVDFVYSSDHHPKPLTEMVLTGAVSKKFNFTYDYNPVSGGDPLFYLKNFEILSIANNQQQVVEKYGFSYHTPLHVNDVPPGNIMERKDWWGYYNRYTTNLFYFPNEHFVRYSLSSGTNSYSTNTVGSNNVNRDPDYDSMVMGMLKSITYPTGGSTEFQYENNYYKDENITKKGPGLRIKKIINKPTNGTDVVRIFKYGENENGTGYINMALKPYKYYVKETSMMVYYDFEGHPGILAEESLGYRVRNYSSDPVINTGSFGGNLTWYETVAEYSGENNTLNWKTVYSYSKKEFDVHWYYVDDQTESLHNPYVYLNPWLEWKGGKLTMKTTFKREGAVLLPLLEETYVYGDYTADNVWDMPTYRHVTFSVDRDNYLPGLEPWSEYKYQKEEDYHNTYCSVIGYGFRHYISGIEYLAGKNVKYFDGNDISTTHTYSYNTQNNQVIEEEVTNSDDKVISYQYEYPSNNLSNPVNIKMMDLNMIAIPLSKSQYVDDVFAQKKGTIYDEFYPDIIRPKTEYFKKANGVDDTIIAYHGYYSNGNIKEVSKKDGTSVYYVWGYQEEYPIAKLENFTSSNATAIQSTITAAINASNSDTSLATEGALRTALTNLRNAAPNAMVTTYTYDPLIGVTSITDPKGYTVYYEYDDFNRLEQVIDANGHILSKNEYNYKQ